MVREQQTLRFAKEVTSPCMLGIVLYLICLGCVSCSAVFGRKDPGGIPQLECSLTLWPDSTENYLRMHLSGGEYDYRNVVIRTAMDVYPGKVSIWIKNTECDGPCIESSYDGDMSAEGTIIFPHLDNGDYAVDLYIKKKRIDGLLHVTPNYFELDLEDIQQPHFYGDHNRIGRDPVNSVVLVFKDFRHEDLVEFIEVLNQSGIFADLTLPSGRYVNFDIFQNGEMEAFGGYNDWDTTILKTYTGDLSAVQSIYDEWKSTLENHDCHYCHVVMIYRNYRNIFLH